MDASSATAPIGIIETDADGIVEAVNETAASLLETDAATLDDRPLPRVFPDATTDALADALAGPTVDATAFREYYPAIDRWLRVEVRPTTDGAAVFLRSRDRRYDLEARVERLERQIDRIETVDDLIADILRQIVDTPGYKAVARSICERLATTDRYAFVWVGERVGTTDRLRSIATGGSAEDLGEAIETELDGAVLPAHRALESGQARTVDGLVEDDTIPETVRLAAFRNGLRSAIAVPIRHEEITYGTIGAYVADEEGVRMRERAALETLGVVAGFAIVSGRQEDLLFADTVTELTLEMIDGTSPCASVTADADASLSLVGVVPVDSAGVVGYLRPSVSAATARDQLEAHPGTVRTRTVQSEAEPLLEVEVDRQTPLSVVTAWGASVERADYRDGRIRLDLTVPSAETPRQLIEVLEERFETVDLLSKQRRSRERDPATAFRETLRDALTDRQRQALRTAYLGEYFASPRGSTAEEVAETLGITAPTLLYHLRKAQRALAAAFFETHTGPDTLDG